MSEEQMEVTSSRVLSASTFITRMSEKAADVSLPVDALQMRPAQIRPAQIRGFFGQLIRQGYGLFKLATAPREALQLCTAKPGTALARLAAEPDRKVTLASQPFVCAKWNARLRLRRMIEHCAVADELGHPLDLNGDQYVEIVTFDLDDELCRLMLDRPRWLACDGMLSVSLWAGLHRVFSVSFTLSDSDAGRTAYIGGIQGHRSGDALDQNRTLTKAAHGMRPRDLAFELFRMLIPRLGVTQLKGVADAYRYQMTPRARMTIGLNDKVQLDYNEIWESRGGVMGDDGFYLVPINYARREIAEIPAKKRAMYKRRYAMLDELHARIVLALQQPFIIHRHAPEFLNSYPALAA